jgi:hypothetical protein
MTDDNNLPVYNWEAKKILVVEDTDTSNRYFNAALKRTKVKILWAKNGLEAIDIIKSDKNVDLILMDIHMPFMNGFEATREIKKMTPHITIIMQTAYVLSNEREKSFEAGADDFIAKPINFKELLEIINRYM